MVAPYQPQPLLNKSFFQNLLGKQNPRNGLIEINNLLSRVEDIQEINKDDFEKINSIHGIDVFKKYPADLELFYKLYLSHALIDRKIDAAELSNLSHLKTVLEIKDVEHIHTQLVNVKLIEEVDKALVDKKLDPEEIAYLDRLIDDLGVSKDTAERLISDKVRGILEPIIKKQIADRQITPQEKKELEEAVKDLNIKVGLDDTSEKLYNKYRLAWLNSSRKQDIYNKGWTELMKENTATTVSQISWVTDHQKELLIYNLIDGYNQSLSTAKLRDRILCFIDMDKTAAKTFAETIYRDINNRTYLSIYRAQGASYVRFKASKKDLEWGPCRSLDGLVWDINSTEIVVPPIRPGCTCRLEFYRQPRAYCPIVDNEIIKNYLEFHDTYWRTKPE
ncbi:hypothetical protein [Methanocella sp. MCL-LM]|uniref:hypothetical protein n=1 Tax=Methanocella sp. MCL-LM TaxID=3412035 RepID=UPI003C72226E